MKYVLALVAMLAFVAMFGMITSMDVAAAQPSNAIPDGEYNDGDYEGKSCPSKEKKTTSVDIGLNI